MKNARTRPKSRRIVANTLAGLLLGVGVSLMMTLYGVVGWSTTTPDLIVVLGVVLGLGVGLLPVRTLRDPVAKTEESSAASSFGSHLASAAPARGNR
jgi:hypothetical protein